MDNPWIIHGYIVFLNYWDGYHTGCSDDPWIHCISELPGWLPHWMSDAQYMDNPWIHCIPELLCHGPGLKPHYPAVLGSKLGP